MKIAFLRFQRQKSQIAMLYLTSKYCRFLSPEKLADSFASYEVCKIENS